MKSPFDKFVNKHVRIDLNSGGSCVGKLVSIEDGWLTVDEDNGQRLVREDDIKEVRAEKVSNSKFLFNVRIGRITFFDPESYAGHIQEWGTGRDWSFSGKIVRDNLLVGKLLKGQDKQLVKFIPATDFSQRGELDVGEVKAVSHHSLRAKSPLIRWLYEMWALLRFAFKNQRRMSKERRGFICDFNRSKGEGQIREDGSETVWSFYGNDIADKDLFNHIYAGALGMQVSFFGHKRSSPNKISNARNIRGLADLGQRPTLPTVPEIRTSSGRITAYFVDRGFGFVKESQSDQTWYFHQKSLAADMQLQASLMRGELNQFVTFSGKPQATPGHEYPAINSMQGAQAQMETPTSDMRGPARQLLGETFFDARQAEQRGDFALAEAIYKKLLLNLNANDASRPNVLKGYAHLLNRLNRANEAIDLVEGNRNAFDAKARLGMLSIFYRKAGRYRDAADTLKQMALNLGLPKNDDKRISYLFQGAECFCEGGDLAAASDMLSYLPAEFNKNDLRYVTAMARINAGRGGGADGSPNECYTKDKNGGFNYPELAKERLAACKYIGLSQQRLSEGNFGKGDIKSVSTLLRVATVDLPPSVAADYYLTMAKIADDIGESSMRYLYKHFLYSAVDAAFGVGATPPRAMPEAVICEVVQAFCCAGVNKAFIERLWYVAIWASCGTKEPISLEGILGKFSLGSLIQTALEKLRPNQEACERFFQTLGIIHRNIPEEGFAFLVDALKNEGWSDCERKITESDRYLSVEETVAELFELENIDERSIVDILSNLTSIIGGLPSAVDREACTRFVELLRVAAKYASQQSSFIKCSETYRQFEYMSKSLVDSTYPSVLSVCLLKPTVRRLVERINANYDKHKSIKPELILELKYDDPDSQTCVTTGGSVALRFRVRSVNEAAPPVHNLQIAVIGEEDGAAPRTEWMFDEEFTGAAVDFSMPPFRLSGEEKTLGEFSISLSASYDTLLGEHCERPYKFAVKLSSESSTWERIDPNPYAETAGGAYVNSEKMFFGRVKLVADIADALRHPAGGQCFVLYGQKRSGKSSVMNAVKRQLIRTEEKCIIADISAQGLVVKGSRKGALFAQFAIMLASRLKTAFSDHRLPIPEDFPTTSEIYDNPMDAVERFVKTIRDEGFFWVVMIDEFTAIHQESQDVVVSFMHNWKAMLQAHLFNALIVGQDTMPKFMDEHPNDFCVSHNIRLSYLNKEECSELASKPIELNGKTRYLEDSLNKIYDWTLGSPYLVQKFCDRLVKRLNAKRRTFVVDADIDAVAKSMCSGPGSERMPEVEFDSFVTAGDEKLADFKKPQLMKALIAVAKESRITGWVPLESIVRESGVADGTAANAAGVVEDLVKRDALIRYEGKLKIPVKLFAEWLRINM